MPHNTDLTEWTDEIPSLYDLDGRGGRPGCEYLYCDSLHEREAQAAGWRRKGPVLLLSGPAGSSPFVVMERGEPIRGLDPGRTSQPLFISRYLVEATGLGGEALRGAPEAPGPEATPSAGGAPRKVPVRTAAQSPANLPNV